MDRKLEKIYGLGDPRSRLKTSQQMAASCTGAIITSLIVTPFDVAKIRIQSQQKNQISKKCYLYCNGLMDHLCSCDQTKPYSSRPNCQPPQGRFTGTLDAFAKISRSEGIGSLWSGLGPTLVLAVPATVAYFVTYEQLRLFVEDRYKGGQPMWAPLVSGGVARLFAVTIVSPLELVRTKMQSKRVSYLEIGQAIKSLLYYHGPRGLFKGLGSTILRDVPFSALYWMNYENFKKIFMETSEPTFWMSFLGGAASGSVAAIVTTPFDVVKTHQQIELGEKQIYLDPPKKSTSSTMTVMKRIYSRNGLLGLFSGLSPRLVKVAPACAIMISTFEYGKLFFHNYNIKQLQHYD